MSNFGSFSYFQTSLSLGVKQGLQKLPIFDINDLRLLFHCNILIPRKCPCKTPFKTQCPLPSPFEINYLKKPKETKRVHAYSPLNSANLSFLTVVTLRLVHTAAPRILLKSEFKTAFACMELEGTAYLFPNFIHFLKMFRTISRTSTFFPSNGSMTYST